MRAPPPYVRVSARWWGDDLVADAARPWVGLDSARDADATFVFPDRSPSPRASRGTAATPRCSRWSSRTGARAGSRPSPAWTSRGSTSAAPCWARARSHARRRHGGVGGRRDGRRLPPRPSLVVRAERATPEAEAAETQAAGTRGEDSGDESGERLDATSVDGGDGGSADAEQRRRSGDDEKNVAETRKAETPGKRRLVRRRVSPRGRARAFAGKPLAHRAWTSREETRELIGERAYAARRRRGVRAAAPRNRRGAGAGRRRGGAHDRRGNRARFAVSAGTERSGEKPTRDGRRGFAVHRVGARRGVPNLEGLRSLERRDDSVGARRRDGVAGRDRRRPGRRRRRRR